MVRAVAEAQVAKEDPETGATAAKVVTVATAAKQETAVQEDKPTVEIHLGPPMQEKAVLLTGVMAAILMGVEAVQQLAARAVAEAMERALQMGDMEVTERYGFRIWYFCNWRRWRERRQRRHRRKRRDF